MVVSQTQTTDCSVVTFISKLANLFRLVASWARNFLQSDFVWLNRLLCVVGPVLILELYQESNR